MAISKNGRRLAGAMLAALLLAPAAQAQPVRVKLDEEATIGEVSVACTGVGQTKDDPKWSAYPVRVEFAGPNGEYVADELLTLQDAKGATLLSVSCEGPWVLLKLPAGKPYIVHASLSEVPENSKSVTIKAPSHGQARFVLTFSNAH
jgi:hypothetical protein